METRDQIRQFLLTNFYVPDPTTLSDDVSLLESGIIDSTGVLEVIAFIEKTFQVTVDDTEMLPENLDSVSRLADYLARKRG
jgi:acyl carrier protein